MSVSSIASLSSAMAAAQTSQDIGVTVLKKAIDISSNSVLELLSAVPSAGESSSSTSLPSNLGQHINTTA